MYMFLTSLGDVDLSFRPVDAAFAEDFFWVMDLNAWKRGSRLRIPCRAPKERRRYHPFGVKATRAIQRRPCNECDGLSALYAIATDEKAVVWSRAWPLSRRPTKTVHNRVLDHG